MLKQFNIEFLENNKFFNIDVPRDGNCFFHSILYCTQSVYRLSSEIEKNNIVIEFRKKLSEILESNIDNTSLRYYDLINNGLTAEFSKHVAEYSLESMKKTLASNSPIGYGFFDFFSMVMDIDIYIINSHGNIYLSDEFSLSIKGNRPCIILYYNNGHYEPVITHKNNTIIYCFQYNDDVSTTLHNKFLNIKNNVI